MKYTKSPIYQYTVYTTATYGNIIEKRLDMCSHPQIKGSVNLEGHRKSTNINLAQVPHHWNAKVMDTRLTGTDLRRHLSECAGETETR